MSERKNGFCFEEKFAESKEYCSLVMNHLRQSGLAVVDRQGNAESQRRGIDFEAAGRTVEFKADSQLHKTGNLAFEVIGNVAKGTPGSCLSSQADYLAYFDVVQKHCHLFSLPGLKELLMSSRNRWEMCVGRTKGKDGKLLYCSLCVLIPLAYAKTRVRYGFADLSGFSNN